MYPIETLRGGRGVGCGLCVTLCIGSCLGGFGLILQTTSEARPRPPFGFM